MKYYNENNTDVTKRIDEGKTTLFVPASKEAKTEAVAFAKNTKTYVYEVFGDNKDRKRVLIGYAVPK